MAMTRQAIEATLRKEIFNLILPTLDEGGYETLQVSNGEFAIPMVDAEGNETFAVVKVSVPRGTRIEGGYDPYDGYALAEEYKEKCEEDAAKKAAAEAKKAKSAEKARARKSAKKTIKTMKEDIASVLPSMTE